MATLTFKQELDQIRALHAHLCAAMNKMFNRLLSRFRRQVAGLKPMGIKSTVYPKEYAKTADCFNNAALAWTRQEQDFTKDLYEADDPTYARWYADRCQRMRENIDREIREQEEARAQIQIELQIKEALTSRKA